MNTLCLAEKGWMPDWLIRVGIRRLLYQRLQSVRNGPPLARFAERLRREPITVAAGEANRQHYEVPTEFFQAVLGPRLKYSCCLYESEHSTQAQAEDAMLELTCRRAGIEDGMDVLDLGCGWGSLSLWIAERYPNCQVTALSNSATQRAYIEASWRERGLGNLRVVTADIASHETDTAYDRILSIEMLEHVRNYERLFARVATWLRPGGALFAHIFCHRAFAYAFEADGDRDWMAKHFFTGGIMPSFDLFDEFTSHLKVSERWRIDGRHYARTCENWLVNLDRAGELQELFVSRFGEMEAKVRLQRWRIFLMACAELFGFRGGSEWMVGHYLLQPVGAKLEMPLRGFPK